MAHLADRLLRDLVSIPTAPFHEERVAAWILRWAEARRIPARLDRAGNVILAMDGRGVKDGVPVVLVAHMDHPGFEVARRDRQGIELEVLGGAPSVRRGAGVRLYGQADETGSAARISGAERRARSRRIARAAGTFDGAQFGMWDLRAFVRRGHRVYARVIDDLAGCAAILAAFDRLHRGAGGGGQVIGCFTRAEEVGFVGATALALSGVLPRDAVVISVEMSRRLAGAEQGKGPVVRVGDRRSIFDPDATQALADVASGLAARRKDFRFQKRILDGGTCEATALRALGYRATGLACPLGNYHNGIEATTRKGRGGRASGTGVGPEFIDIRDWRNLVELIAAAARGLPRALEAQSTVRARVEALHQRYRHRLMDGMG